MERTLSSVENALRILGALRDAGPLGVSEIARTLGLSTSTVHRLVTTLCAQRFARQVPEGTRYVLGPAMAPSASVTAVEHCAFVARPHMRALRDVVDETVHLCTLRGEDVMFVASVESPRAVRINSRVGDHPRAELTAAGKVLLAHSGSAASAEQDATVAPSETGTTQDRDERLRQQLERVRADDYARNLRESEIDMYAIAVPVRRPNGAVMCALSIAAPYSRVLPASDGLGPDEQTYLAQLRRTVRAIEAGLAF